MVRFHGSQKSFLNSEQLIIPPRAILGRSCNKKEIGSERILNVTQHIHLSQRRVFLGPSRATVSLGANLNKNTYSNTNE